MRTCSRRNLVVTSAALALLMAVSARAQEAEKPLRAGIIGLDTSHVVAFTKVLNDPKAPAELSGVRVVAAFPGGSPDVASSRDRVEGFTKTMRETYGVEIVDSIDALLSKVDVVLLESVDGRPHLSQVEPVLRAKKPVFIDKPVAGSLADAIQIYALAEKHRVPVMSCSSVRYSPFVVTMRDNPAVGAIVGCESYSPCSLEEHHPDLFWYGIHGVEGLYTLMGTGCVSVSRTQTEGTELVVGVWNDGRVGTFRGIRQGQGGYGVLVYGEKGVVHSGGSASYGPMLVEVVKFFKTGKAPIPAAETIELFAFMEAADASKRAGGKPVTIESVMEAARKVNASR